MNNHAEVNNGLSRADMCARIGDALQRLSQVRQDPKTTEQMEMLFLVLSLFVHDPPSNWNAVTANLYKSKAIPALLRNAAIKSDAPRTRTYYYWLNGEMALAAGDRPTARSCFGQAKAEYTDVRKSIEELGYNAPLIRRTLEEKLRLTRATSP